MLRVATRQRLLIVAVSAALLLPSLAAANDEDFERESLKGLRTIGVLMYVPSNPLRLEPDDLRTDVELPLRKNGIVVRPDNADALLHARVYITPLEEGPFIFSIQLQVYQPSTIVRTGKRHPAVTWELSQFGYLRRKDPDEIRKSLRELIDSFLNAFLSANPKQ